MVYNEIENFSPQLVHNIAKAVCEKIYTVKGLPPLNMMCYEWREYQYALTIALVLTNKGKSFTVKLPMGANLGKYDACLYRRQEFLDEWIENAAAEFAAWILLTFPNKPKVVISR